MKILFISILVILVCFLSFSCKKDSDVNVILLSRTWLMVEQSGSDGIQKVDPNGVQHVFTFYKDSHFIEDWVGWCCKYEGHWSTNSNGKILYLKYSDYINSYEIYELHTNWLKLGSKGRCDMTIDTYIPIKLTE